MRVYCGICRATSLVEGAAIPRLCPACGARGAMKFAGDPSVRAGEPIVGPAACVCSRRPLSQLRSPLDETLAETRGRRR